MTRCGERCEIQVPYIRFTTGGMATEALIGGGVERSDCDEHTSFSRPRKVKGGTTG